MGRHRARQAVFVDDSGRRARRARLLLRGATGVLVIGVLAVLVSFLGGVPMPGVNPPVGLPSGEPAHPRTHGVPTPTATPTLQRAATVPTGGDGAPPTGSGVATPASRPTPAAPPAPTPTPAPSSSTAAGSSTAPPTGHATPPKRNTTHPTPSNKPTSP